MMQCNVTDVYAARQDPGRLLIGGSTRKDVHLGALSGHTALFSREDFEPRLRALGVDPSHVRMVPVSMQLSVRG